MITETDRLAEALDHAARVWPEHAGNRAALLRAVLDKGLQAIEATGSEEQARKVAALDQAAGGMTGIWPANWREELRSEWPA